ncbi:phage tail tape measure protein, partial [Klebsiella pneumoniae]|nr:phage tail tape measure protein [Klebsiella pneumoniae]
LDGARGKADEFAKGLNSAADKVLKIGAAAGGVAVAGMTAFAKSAVSTGQQFDAAMSQVAATMGVSVDSIQELRDYAQKMGAETAF